MADVSCETHDRLHAFIDLLQRWNRRINLIGPSAVETIWQRHVEDSAQLSGFIKPEHDTLLDLGSGAGFPGLVLAILARDRHPQLTVSLCESDTRKCAFLREASRQTDTSVVILNQRIEAMSAQPSDVITARALTSLDRLFAMAERFAHEKTELLLLKGAKAEQELTDAARTWHSKAERFPSLTDRDGVILRVTGLRRLS